MSVRASQRRGFGSQSFSWWPTTTSWWMGTAFLIALVSAVIVLAAFGAGERGTAIALRLTGRWSFLLFWCAYVGGATAKLFGPRFSGMARHGREFGLAFASAHLVHVGLVLWLYHISAGPADAMALFWGGVFFTYLLALFSWPRLRDMLGPFIWRTFMTIALECIALTFALDFIVGPVQAVGLGKFPHGYLPFALMLICGAGLRIVVFLSRAFSAAFRSTLP